MIDFEDDFEDCVKEAYWKHYMVLHGFNDLIKHTQLFGVVGAASAVIEILRS